MTDRTPPHDLDAERALLGALMLRPEQLPAVDAVLGPEDLYSPAHAETLEAIRTLWRRGGGTDVVTLRDELEARGRHPEPAWLIGLQSAAPSLDAGRYAEIVARHALSRRAVQAAAEITEAVYAGQTDRAREIASTLAAEHPGALTAHLRPAADVVRNEQEAPRPWLIPGLLREGWRVMLTAGEGHGKSSILYQFGWLASHGLHPFHYGEAADPITVLMVDCENDPTDIELAGRRCVRQLAKEDREGGRFFVWERPEGIDLRGVSDRREFEGVLRYVRPQLVFLSPLYKVFRRRRGEDHEAAAAEMQDVLDSFRTRHRFALIIEHHGRKGQNGERDYDPFGSSLWMRWPDLGYSLVPLTPEGKVSRQRTGTLGVWSFRGDRKLNAWPSRIEHRDEPEPFPWAGWWRQGIPESQPEEMF